MLDQKGIDMNKIGPTFSDFVTSERRKRSVRGGKGLLSAELRLFSPLFVMGVLFSILLVRLFYLQIVRGNYYTALADENRTRSVVIPASRGIIYDRNGKELVHNEPAFEVLEKGKVVWIEKDRALELMAQGKDVIADVKRNYLYKDALAHVLGYVGQVSSDELLQPNYKDYSVSDFNGKMGLEKQYERILHGQNGKKLYEVDAQGKRVRFLGQQDAIPGENITTTLVLEVQRAAASAMKDIKKGAVVVSNPHDGGILALYSQPSFDPNLFTHDGNYKAQGAYKNIEGILTDGQNQPLLNRTISGVYPPGSTYKLITAIAGLEEDAITKSTQIEDTGELKVGGISFGNWYYHSYGKTEGAIDVVEAIKRSNDIFFYKTAEKVGINKLEGWSTRFGLGTILGIDLPGEARGTFPDAEWKKDVIGESWYLGDTFNTGIGQGYVLTTPLQVNTWTVPFANGGIIYRPHLVKEDTEIIRKDFMTKEHIDLVRKGMKESCEQGGVAWPFFDFKVKNERLPIDGRDYTESASGSAKMVKVAVGCKTGTSQTGGDDTLPHSWITVFAPFYNPEIVVTVLAETSGEGSNVAGPIARDILKAYFENKR